MYVIVIIILRKVLEWQQRLEDLRLRDLRSRRNAEHWSKELEHLRELTRSQALKIDHLEEEVVRLENQMEQKQLDWETKEVELEALEDDRQKHLGESKAGGDADVSKVKMPDPDLPLSRQLEQAIGTIKDYSRTVEQLKGKLSDAKKAVDDLQKKAREYETSGVAKDRIINDLRLQVPASVERAVAVASVTSGKLSLPLTEDYESRQALSIAQDTVTSLRERLRQKEETLERYEAVLRQSREEYDEEIRRRQEEIVSLQVSLRNAKQSYNELKSYNAVHGGARQPSSTSVIGQQSHRINELQDEVQDLQASLRDLSTQLVAARAEADKQTHVAAARQKEIGELKESAEMERQILKRQAKQELEKAKTEMNVAKQENLMLQDDLQNLKEAQEKAPSAILKSLVEKLRNDLAEKDKKQRAMSRAITELKQELVARAEEGAATGPGGTGGGGESKAEIIASYKQKMSELHARIERLQRQLKSHQDREVSSVSQIKALKEELAKKSSLLVKLKEEKGGQSSGAGQLSAKVRFVPPAASEAREKEELRKTIRKLEERLRDVNQAERPLEDQSYRDTGLSADEKAIKNAEEVARWEEKKKWEHKMEAAKKKLDEADEEVSKLSKSNKGLRDIVTRLEREKMVLESRAKAAAGKDKSRAQLEKLQRERDQLAEQLESVKHDRMMSEAPGVETMRLRNQFLQERIEAQEKKITALQLSKKFGGGSDELLKEFEKVQEKEKECQKRRAKVEEENLNLKLRLQALNDRAAEGVGVLASLVENNVGGDDAKKALALMKEIAEGKAETPAAGAKQQPTSSRQKVLKSSTREMKLLLEELKTLKDMNRDLLAKLEAKTREFDDYRDHQQAAKKRPKKAQEEEAIGDATADAASDPTRPPRSFTAEQIRQLEADLKRKSDLLSEVKVLLRSAAERERRQLAESDELKRRFRLVLEVDPKTPSEALAKELRQTRLTVDRLECEKRELEHKLAEAHGRS